VWLYKGWGYWQVWLYKGWGYWHVWLYIQGEKAATDLLVDLCAHDVDLLELRALHDIVELVY
jgi:hypothetical protein